ncbi:MAG: hypothetical protein FJ102_12685, partial [Deltaproteobacteria bacterium]|nr:hypothetical protein [Deltaproteobacteria bacterium]
MSVLLLLAGPAWAGDLLIVGASYVDRNDVEVMLEDLLDEGSGRDRSVTALCENGMTWAEHVARVGTDETWTTTLRDTAWTGAFLHEFADVADQPVDSEKFLESLAAGQQLAAYLGGNGAAIYVWLTWGDRTGGPHYDDYTGMQDALKTGAETYAATFNADGYPSYVAPIGEAFRYLHDAEADPLAAETLFTALYTSDNQHPTPTGSYLAALVMYSTLVGESPAGLSAPANVSAAISPDDVSRLQDAAWIAIEQTAAAGYAYPWQGGGDTGTPDTGTPDTGNPGDTGDDPTPADSGNGDTAADAGTG